MFEGSELIVEIVVAQNVSCVLRLRLYFGVRIDSERGDLKL